MSDLLTQLEEKAKQLGFSMVGVIPAQPARRLDAYMGWIEKEMHGRMGYLARPDRQIRRQDLNVVLPGVQSLVCVGLDYHTIKLPDEIANDPSRGRISNYAWGSDYHDLMTPRLKELADWLAHTAGEETKHKVYVDTGAVLERDHAETAGFGFTGKNTMLINPRRGSWFFLGEIFTTLPLPPHNFVTPTQNIPSCGSCTRCLNACPTDAFPRPYVLDARRCISYLTIELKAEIPEDMRPLLGNWIYGCDVCQEVCPFNRFAPESVESAFRATSWEVAAPPLLELLALTDEGFKQRFAGSPIKRVKRERFLRNVCVAAGNWGDTAVVEPLRRLLSDPSALVKEHAAWALGRVAKS